jgi:hypothetical protein
VHVRFGKRRRETGRPKAARRSSPILHDGYCYLPLYVFCGRHLLAAKLRSADQDAAAGSVEEAARIIGQIRVRWPQVRIVLRADSGFARQALMAWCEQNGVNFLFGLQGDVRLVAEIATEFDEASAASQADQGRPARRFKDFSYRPRRTAWSRAGPGASSARPRSPRVRPIPACEQREAGRAGGTEGRR